MIHNYHIIKLHIVSVIYYNISIIISKLCLSLNSGRGWILSNTIKTISKAGISLIFMPSDKKNGIKMNNHAKQLKNAAKL